MGGDWEQVGATKKAEAAKTRSKTSTTTTKSKLSESVKPRKPLREKNAQNATASHTQQVSSKQAAFKSLEECRKAIGNAKTLTREIESLFERNQDRPNIWLNELTGYLVNRCNIAEKHIPKSTYLKDTYLELDKDVDAVLAKALRDDSARYIKSHTRSTLYHETLLSLSEDASRNRPTVGYKIMLQILAKHYPQDCQKSISDRHFFHASQAHAYRSNPSTCMPLLWAMGLPFLAQPASLTSQQAVDVLERAMIPVAENKPINHYVVYYLEKMVQQSKKINMKRPLLTPATVALIVDLMFNAHFDAADQAKLKDIVNNGLVIPAEAFENLLSLLDKNKNVEFKQFVLETILGILSGNYGEEACQIWNLKYGGNITESAILLKFLVDEMHGMDKRTRQLLSKTTKQFSKANAKFLESGSSSPESKKAMAWVDSMCDDVANGGSKSSKKQQSRSTSRKSKTAGKRTFFGTLFSFASWMAILYCLTMVTLDLVESKWQWGDTATRSMIVKAHPFLEENLPIVEGHLRQTSDLIVLKTSQGYRYVHDLAPEQFDLVEGYLAMACGKVEEVYAVHVYPVCNMVFTWLDSQFMECLIFLKSNQYDEKIIQFMDSATQQVHKVTAAIVEFTSNLSKDAPKHLKSLQAGFHFHYHQTQLKVGKFLFDLKPTIAGYWELICATSVSTWTKVTACSQESWTKVTVFSQENFGDILEQSKVLGAKAMEQGAAIGAKVQPVVSKASETIAPLWNKLEQQFFQVFDQIMGMAGQQ